MVFVVAATCIRLGVWQLDRLEQRRAVNAVVAERMAQPPIDADEAATDSSGAYRHLRLAGSCEDEPIVLAARSRNGAPGVHLLCRFRTAGGRVLLLDRGWLPSPDARTLEPGHLDAIPADTTFDALAIPFPEGSATTTSSSERRLEHSDDGVRMGVAEPRVIYRLNRTQAEAVVGAPLPPWYVQALGPDDALPAPAEPPDLSEGPHFSYAVQWFSFATIALVGWLILVLRRRTPAAPAQRDESPA